MRNPVRRGIISYNWQSLSITEISNRNLMQSWVKAIHLSNSTCWWSRTFLSILKQMFLNDIFFREIEDKDIDNLARCHLVGIGLHCKSNWNFFFVRKKIWQKSKNHLVFKFPTWKNSTSLVQELSSVILLFTWII